MSDIAREVESLFRRARRLDADARRRFLDDAGADDEVRREVERLLAAHDRSGFLDDPQAMAPVRLGMTSPRAPRIIAGYRIRRRLGDGGMGVVWLAEQETTSRTVALKLIRAGLGGPSVIRRFRQEAMALGRLQHPGVARAYEAGVAESDDGDVPFLAMEYVEGPTLDAWLRSADPDQTRRVEILLALCDAVRHAHERGVVHRDLKPANIIIEASDDGAPQPKILDFGLAQLVVGEDAFTTLHTRTGAVIGTVQYMSPEQAAGAPDVDARVDVYALGVIGYEMLTGAPPYDVGDRPLHEAVGIVRDREPVPPSSIDRRLRGDLETILLKALEKDPARRFASVALMADDLRRTLRHEPIEARPASRWYRTSKFVRRHRGPVMAVTAVFVALVIGLVFAVQFALSERQARGVVRQQLAEVRELVNSVIFEVDDTLRGIPGTLEARQLLVGKGIAHLDAMAAESTDPELAYEVALGYYRLCDIQGGEDSSLNDVEGAMTSLDKAAVLLRERGDPDRVVSHAVLAIRIPTRRARFLVSRDPPRSLALINATVPEAQRLAEAYPHHLVARRVYSDALAVQSTILRVDDQLDEARGVRRRAMAVLDEIGYETGHEDLVRSLAVDEFQLAMMDVQAGDWPAALDGFRHYVGQIESLLNVLPAHPVYRRDLIVGHERVGQSLLALERHEEALVALTIAVEEADRFLAVEAEDGALLGAATAARIRLIDALIALGRPVDAAPHADRALELTTRMTSVNPNSRAAQREHGVALYKQAEWRAGAAAQPDEDASARWQGARDWFTRCRDHFTSLVERDLLAPSDAGIPGMVEGEIERCDAAFAANAPG